MVKLVANPLSLIKDPTFENGDCLGRKAFGQYLSRLIVAAKDGAVIALDAPWGEGKTTFVKMWQHTIKETGAVTVYLDAFEQDHIEDPFVPLVATLLEMVEHYGTQKTDVITRIKAVWDAVKNHAAKPAAYAVKTATGISLNVDDVNLIKKLWKAVTSNTPNTVADQLNIY